METIAKLTPESNLRIIVDTLNKFIEMGNINTKTLMTLTKSSGEPVKVFEATQKALITGEVYTLEMSGMYQVVTSGQGRTKIIIKDHKTDSVIDTIILNNAGQSKLYFLSEGDKVYIHSSPAGTSKMTTEFMVVQTMYDLMEESNIASIKQELTQSLNILSETASKLIGAKLDGVHPEMFGAKGDGKTDDTNAIAQAIAYCNANSINRIEFKRGKIYCISSTVFIPTGLDIDFNFAEIQPITGGSFTQGYVFGINTTDCVTWTEAYSSKMTKIRNLRAHNQNLLNGVKLFFVAGPIQATHVHSRKFYGTFVYPNLYVDYAYYEDITIVDHYGGDTYGIQKGGQGDSVYLKGIHALKYLSNTSLNIVYLGATSGALIELCLNGNYKFYNSRNVKILNSHFETGTFNIINSQVVFDNCYMWKESNTSKITVIDQQAQYSGDISYPIVLRDVIFKLRYSDKRYTEDCGDIDISQFNGDLSLNNVYRACELRGANYVNESLTGVSIKTADDALTYPKEKNTLIRKKQVIQQSSVFTNDTDGYWSLSGVNTVTDDKTTWKATNGTYFYKPCILFDETRRAGIVQPSTANVKSVTVGDKLLAKLLIDANLTNCSLRIYRGSSNTVFEKYVDIPYCVSRVLIDTGEDINGFPWKDNENADAAFYPLNPITKIDYDTNDAGKLIAYSKAIPTLGTWKKGDIIYNTNPTSGSYLGWICTADGTPGTWKGFGEISE